MKINSTRFTNRNKEAKLSFAPLAIPQKYQSKLADKIKNNKIKKQRQKFQTYA